MRVAVTGGAGFIGSATCRLLSEIGHTFFVVDRNFGYDITEPSAVFEALEGCDAVIHLAGMLGTSELFSRPRLAVEVNVGGTLNVLRACERYKMAYVGITMPEVFPSIYTATKRGARALEEAYHYSCGVPVSRVRAFNAYGPGQAHGLGHPQKIIPTFAVEAWSGRPIPIWGDGEQTVDLVHVDTLAGLLVLALDHGDNFTVDGGTGLAVTVNEVAGFVLGYTGSTAGVKHLPMRRGEVPTHIVATGEGWDRMSFRPPSFPQWETIGEAVDSYKDHPCVSR